MFWLGLGYTSTCSAIIDQPQCQKAGGVSAERWRPRCRRIGLWASVSLRCWISAIQPRGMVTTRYFEGRQGVPALPRSLFALFSIPPGMAAATGAVTPSHSWGPGSSRGDSEARHSLRKSAFFFYGA